MEESISQTKILTLDEIESKYNISFEDLKDSHEIIVQIFNSENINPNDYNLEDVTILLIIANYYELVKQDDELALQFNLLAVDKSSPSAMYEVGNYYYKKGNEELMIKYYDLAISNEITEPIVILGSYFRRKKDYELMKKYFDIGIEKGCSESMYQLGLYYYLYGKDNELAKKYYLMASEQFHPEALYQLSRFYEYIEKDPEQCVQYLNLAIEYKSEKAIMHMAKSESSYSKKKKYLEMGVELANTEAIYELANLLWRREKEENKDKIKVLLTKASDLGHVESSYQLGAYYKQVESNPELSIKYFGLSAEKDFVEALFALGNIYIEKKEYDTGVKYYERAIKQGHVRSMYNLGIYYQTVVKNSSMSVMYFQRASDKGFIDATKKLYFHYKNTEPNEKLKKKYMDILEKKEQEIMMNNMRGHGLNSIMSLFGMFID